MTASKPSLRHTPPRFRVERCLAVVALLSLTVNLAFFSQRVAFGIEPTDQREYYQLAVNVLEGRGFFDGYWLAHRPPLYSYLMAAVFKVIGATSRDAILLLQAAIGATTCVLVAWLGDRLFDRPTGFLAGVTAALYPALPWFTTFVLYETLYVFLTAALLCALHLWSRAGRNLWGVAVGLLLGLMLLAHGKTFLLLPFVLCYMLWRGARQLRRTTTGIGLATVAMIVVCSPWVYRNYRLFERFVPVNTSGGLIAYQAYNPHDPALLDHSQPALKRELASLSEPPGDEIAMSQLGYRLASEWIRLHPWQTVQLLARKAQLFVNPRIEPNLLLRLAFAAVSLASFLGIVILWRSEGNRRSALALLSVPIAWTATANILSLVFYRYRLPMLPSLAVLAAVALARGVTALLNTRGGLSVDAGTHS